MTIPHGPTALERNPDKVAKKAAEKKRIKKIALAFDLAFRHHFARIER